MLSSFLISSAFKGPTPFKYSIGLDNILADTEIINVFTNIFHLKWKGIYVMQNALN
jgi:hypothetical protein